MNYYDINLKKFVDYFKNGIKQKEDKTLGVELEHFIVKENMESVDYYEEHGVRYILEKLSPFFDEKVYKDGNLIGLSKNKSNISLEPASQLEISIGPFIKVADILEEYSYFLLNITPILKELNYKIVYSGYQPKSKVDNLNLIPKKRYEYMLDYFSSVGNHGKNMMKGSASTQVSVDYFSEEDFKNKFRLANIFSPLISLMTDNTFIFEGEEYKKNCIRVEIWNDVDKDRSMVVKDALNKDFGFEDYAKYILDAPAILIEDEQGNSIYTKDKKIKDIYKNKEITKKDIEHLISMFFPDVRLKNYVEIRMADCMPMYYALSYAAIIKGIFYNEETIKYFLDKFSFVRNEDVIKAKEEIIQNGYEAKVYGFYASDIIMEMIEIAKENLHEEEKESVDLFYQLAKNKLTLKMKKERGE
ncbi:glutamate-cysteine ligase family protein [Anaerofustis sp. NSJ-163]|uniref:glutamate-cysteine ligase family protein n=1 Tax=Anaerofustis sp. NSJ-163 TaxID=2944391 RepID=UPI00209C0337|nr:glutamate-cysteine ligase family protein [Anaerofustis sp. NSJ-163]MCO8194462.1 glutamate-cysteine ligase family protein [Anaerofustis sp. NSJ-163]